MRARALKDFPGVPDGQVHPQAIAKGDIITGGLAEIAVAGKLAEVIGDAVTGAEAAAPAPASNGRKKKPAADAE